MYAGDQLVRSMIMSIPQFQRDGRFDQASYERALRYQGLSSKAFEQSMRLRLVSNQLSRAIEASEFVTERELNDAIRLRNQKRQFDYMILPVAEFMDDQEISGRGYRGLLQVPSGQVQSARADKSGIPDARRR